MDIIVKIILGYGRDDLSGCAAADRVKRGLTSLMASPL